MADRAESATTSDAQRDRTLPKIGAAVDRWAFHEGFDNEPCNKRTGSRERPNH